MGKGTPTSKYEIGPNQGYLCKYGCGKESIGHNAATRSAQAYRHGKNMCPLNPNRVKRTRIKGNSVVFRQLVHDHPSSVGVEGVSGINPYQFAFYGQPQINKWQPDFEIATVYPSLEEMANGPIRYVIDILQGKLNLHKSMGLVKVVPPPEYQPRLQGYEDLENEILSSIKLQNISANRGHDSSYFIYNEESWVMTMEEYRRSSNETMPPPPEGFDKEMAFWSKSRLLTKKPFYATDVGQSESLFDKDCKVWNLGRLNSILDLVGEKNNGKPAKGLNKSYVYYASWGSCFPWHKENMDMFSINFNHVGEDKIWYNSHPEDDHQFYKGFAKEFKEQVDECSTFYRHKNAFLSPAFFKQYGIRYSKINQKAGEFIIAFAGGWHQGFNEGFNIAEAVNFATPDWINTAEKAKSCQETCDYSQEDFTIDMKWFKKRFREGLKNDEFDTSIL